MNTKISDAAVGAARMAFGTQPTNERGDERMRNALEAALPHLAADAAPVAFCKDGVLFWHGDHAAHRGEAYDLFAHPQPAALNEVAEQWIGEDGPQEMWVFLDAATNVTGYSETGPELIRPGERAVKFVREAQSVAAGDERARFEEWAAAQCFRAGNVDTTRSELNAEWYASDVPWLTGSAWRAALAARLTVGQTFQAGVSEWMGQCFLPSLYSNMTERGDRLLEEVLELLQAHGYDQGRVATLVDYVFGRPIGEPAQEVGGVMVTLAGYCWVAGLDMHAAGDDELRRITQPEVMDKIRRKQEAKKTLHFDTPLPGNAAPPAQGIDLGQFRKLSDAWAHSADVAMRVGNDQRAAVLFLAAKELRDLIQQVITQRDAGAGVGS